MRGQLCTLNTAVRALRIRGPSRQLHQQAGTKPACALRSQAPARPFKQHHPRHSLPRPANNHQGVANGRAAYTTEATVTGDPTVHGVFEPKTGTWQYLVADPATWSAVIIDPVLDFDSATQAVGTHAADSLLALATNRGYKVDRILETHMHADHLSAASYIQSRLAKEHGYRAPIGIGRRIGNLQRSFGQRYGIPAEEYEGVFDDLFEDDETFGIGKQTAMAIHLPGHTPDHLGYKIGNNVFCGDSLFHGDIGTARCDFPGGSANSLFASGRKLLRLPDDVKIWTGHDYPPAGRETAQPYMSVGDHKQQNKYFKGGVTEEQFVAMRKERDAHLAQPKLLHQSLQMNIRAGRLPKPTETGHRMLHLPLALKGVEW